MDRLPRVSPHPLEPLFHPAAVAVVGVSKSPENPGNQYFRQLLAFPFQGPVYPVGKEEKEILGVPCYGSLAEIPGPVDYVISCVPNRQGMALVNDCILKKVRFLHLYTARLAETQLPEQIDLEREIAKKARAAGIRVIGPNCMGLYCPDVGLTFRFSFPREPGSIAFVSQSGGNAADLEYQGVGRGLRFSKIISFGNASDLNEVDFLDYLIDDPQTRIIAMYLEGVKGGRRLFDLFKRLDGEKPVILFKAGRTAAGSRAVVSHTASISGEEALWAAVCRQYGIVRVHSMWEMADALLAFQLLRPSGGRRVIVMGGGGGGSVAAADVCELEGFEVPPLPPEMREELKSLAPEVWSMISNPMDGSVMGGMGIMRRCYQMGIDWKGADIVIANSSALWLLDHPDGELFHRKGLDYLINLAGKAGKPMVIIVDSGDPLSSWRVEATRKARETCSLAGIPVYPDIQRASRALAHFTGYHRRRARRR
ncbi:MAG: CoA-binding protein [Deltaproteobacteria bacterium]|nr:CoA-binding protein [Deltaproteobacteria bacterium]